MPSSNSSKMRSSNIELLRIFAMLAIVLYHIVVHCVDVQITDSTSIARLGNGYFCYPLIFKKLFLLYAIMPLGPAANAIFMLISGYFMVQKGMDVDTGKSAKKLLLQLGFAAFILMLASTIVYRLYGRSNGTFISLTRIDDFSSMSWFIGYYFAVLLIGKLFLNERLCGLNRKSYVAFLLTLFAVFQLSWSGGLLDALAGGLRTLATGIFLYALGGFIRRYDPFAKIKSPQILILIAFVYLCVFISSYNNDVLTIENYYLGDTSQPFVQSIPIYGDHDIVVILLGVSTFELFRRLRMPSSRAINFFGAATFMVYLIHDNAFIYSLWATKDWATLLDHDSLMFIIELLVMAAITFLVGTLCYAGYLGLSDLIGKRLGGKTRPAISR